MVATRVLIPPQRFEGNTLMPIEPIRGNNYTDAERTKAFSRRPDTMPNEEQMAVVGYSAISTTDPVSEEYRAQIHQIAVDNAWIMAEFTDAERAEISRRYQYAQEHPITVTQLRNMPDLLDPDFG